MVRSIRGALKEIQNQDPQTAITLYAIRKIIKENKIDYVKSGKKYLVNVEKLINYINCEKESKGK